MTSRLLCVLLVVLAMTACGGSKPPTQPPPSGGGNPPANNDPPANTKPTIDAITVQGRRAKQPANFADVRETIDVSATVRDPETNVDELIYQWSATVGTFAGTGRNVTWIAPDSVTQATSAVTITLKVVENFGHPGQAKIFSQDVSSTAALMLHDSAKEVGDMAVRFLDRFSQPQTIKDWRDIMRDFKAEACPEPNEVEQEREQVINHYTNFWMNSYTVDPASVSVSFKTSCAVPGRNPNLGDACATVRVRWDSTDLRNNQRGVNAGLDYLAAAYSTTDKRWWLCASQFIPQGTFTHSFYSVR